MSNKALRKTRQYVDAEVTKCLKNVPRRMLKEVKALRTAMVMHDGYENPDYKWGLKDFELGQLLGHGAGGKVYLAREKKTGYLVALKIISKADIIKRKLQHVVKQELLIQSNLKHKNILKLFIWFHDAEQIYLVLEYAEMGTVFDRLQDSRDGYFSEQTTARYIFQVASALKYCQKNHVMHRDVKPENLLLSVNGEIKLADFGCAIHSPNQRRNLSCGTVDYMPPEMAQHKLYGRTIDNWSIGVLCYELLVGSPPFSANLEKTTYSKIIKLDFTYPTSMSEGSKDFISKLLKKKEDDRMTLSDAMKHPWIIANMD